MMMPAQAQQLPIMSTFFAESSNASQKLRKVKRVSELSSAMKGTESVAALAQRLTLLPMHMMATSMTMGSR